MLDTDTAIEVLRGRNRPVVERLAATPRKDIALSVVRSRNYSSELTAAGIPTRVHFAGNSAALSMFCP